MGTKGVSLMGFLETDENCFMNLAFFGEGEGQDIEKQ